jgi:phage I-like protein
MMSDQDYATVSGTKVHRSDFAYAPAGSEPSEWKLPIHDASHVRNALARFNQTELPEAAKAEAHAKIMRAAKKFGIDAKEHGSDPLTPCPSPPKGRGESESFPHLVVLLTGAGSPVDTPTDMTLQRPDAQLREIAVAVPGSWVKGDHKFSIKKEDLGDMVRNFEKRKNDMIVIDYEHASEDPQVARGGPIPGAGWIHKLRLGGNGSADLQVGMPASRPALHALVEWTPQAEEMLRTGQYRFFSPAIDWGACDKETGEPQGATLTSGALTNHPFLEELPPIMLSDGTLLGSGRDSGLNVRGSGFGTQDSGIPAPNTESRSPKTESRNPKGEIRMADEEKKHDEPDEEKLGDAGDTETMSDAESSGEGHGLPMLQVHKGRAGTKHEGHHIFSSGGKMLGCMSEKSLKGYAAKHLGASAEKATEEVIDVTKLILSEVAKDGKLNNQRASELAAESKITLADYIRAQEAEKLIDGAIQAGKILPKDRKFFFRDALERPAEFAEYVKSAPQAVKLGVHGIGEAESMSPDQEVTALTKKLIEEKKLQYPAALKQVLTENPGLAERYRAAHSARVNSDGTAN